MNNFFGNTKEPRDVWSCSTSEKKRASEKYGVIENEEKNALKDDDSMYEGFINDSVTFMTSFVNPGDAQDSWHRSTLKCSTCDAIYKCNRVSGKNEKCALEDVFFNLMAKISQNSKGSNQVIPEISGKYVLKTQIAKGIFGKNIIPDNTLCVGAVFPHMPDHVNLVEECVRDFVKKHATR